MSIPAPIRSEVQIRGKRLDLGGTYSFEGNAAATAWLHESIPGAKDAHLEVEGDAILHGNLDVKGTLTYIESTIMQVVDPNITLNQGGNDLTADGAGITINRATSPFPSLIFRNALNAWACGFLGVEKEITTEGNVFNIANTLVKLDGNSKVPIYSMPTFTFNQLIASSSWVISHGMNKRPSVSVVTSAGDEVVGDVSYVDDNNLVVNFSAPFAGIAYLN